MDELDDGRGIHVLAARVTAGPRRKHDAQRPQSLAAAADDVLRDLVDQHDVAGQALDDDPVYLAKVIRHRLPDTF